MKNLFASKVSNKNYQDAMGVLRGLYRVRGEVFKRYPFFLDDVQRFGNKLKATEYNIDVSFLEVPTKVGTPKQKESIKSQSTPLETNQNPERIVEEQKAAMEKAKADSKNESEIRTDKSKKFMFDYEKYQKDNDDKFQSAVQRKVPSSSFGRAYEFSKLGASVLGGALTSSLTSKLGFSKQNDDLSKNDETFVGAHLLTEANAEKISETLCKMRGAALKLGQAITIQEDNLIPEPLRKAFDKAGKSANIMPEKQLHRALATNLGSNWREKFLEFNDRPIAAASIGQVHKAKLQDGQNVILKVQYPGVSQSVDSDLDNLKMLMEWTGAFPKGLYLSELIDATRIELKEECNYYTESSKQKKYHSMFSKYKGYRIPRVYDELSTEHILTMEFLEGVDINTCASFPQDIRNSIGRRILELTIREIFQYRYMQTDPNPANFFYNVDQDIVNLLDFGATFEYGEEFVYNYLDIVYGSAQNDAAKVLSGSKKLGFLSGEESKIMIDAHIESVLIVGLPFAGKGDFNFGDQNMTKKIYKLMPVMMKNRLKAPPKEIYSLHRKLAGSYLLNMMLKTQIPARDIFMRVVAEVRPDLLRDSKIKTGGIF